MHRHYWRSLDGLRAIAALIVLLSHAGAPFLPSGGVGVDIFFVLSGFLITTILSGEINRYGGLRFGNFYMRRFLRLAPCLVLVAISYGLWVAFVEGRFPFAIVLVVLTYTTNWAMGIFGFEPHGLRHCWSLAIEEQYYLIWPLVILSLDRATKSAWLKGTVLLILAGIVASYRASVVGAFSAERIYFGLDTHSDGLIIGSSLAYFHAAISRAPHPVAERVCSFGIVPLAIAILVGVISKITWHDPEMGTFGFLIVAIAAAAIIADLVWSRSSWLARVLSLRPLVYLGTISYGLYLWHFPIYAAFNHYLPGRSFFQLGAWKVGVSILVAAISYQWFERRFLELKSRFQRPDPSDAASGVEAGSAVLAPDPGMR